MNDGLAKGPYVAARVGFEPMTFRTQGTEPTTEPPCLTTQKLRYEVKCNVIVLIHNIFQDSYLYLGLLLTHP